MKRYEIIQTVRLGYIEVPAGLEDTDDILEYMSANDLWPDPEGEVVLETGVFSVDSGRKI